MKGLSILQHALEETFDKTITVHQTPQHDLVVEVDSNNLLKVAKQLRDKSEFRFEVLIDLCVVDRLHYGMSEWETQSATSKGFSRGTTALEQNTQWANERFQVVYHLLSIEHNQRLRIKTTTSGEPPIVPSIVEIWNSANWYEREAFDLFGVWFDGHPDLRRILTDYGFIGHPFRKDFPLIGEVAMRYSASEQRVIYEPVDIEPRTLVPKVIRDDNRYVEDNT